MSATGPTPPKDLPHLRVAVIDDHTILVDALRLILQSQRDMEVVGTAGSCAEGLEMVQRTRPQVLILDVGLPDGDGIELVPALKGASPETNILILTSLSDEATMQRAMQAGASGFLPKSRNLPEVLKAVRKASQGEIVMSTSLLAGVLSRTPTERGPATPQVTLSQRELEILRLLSLGESVDEVAARLNISLSTARTHIRNLMQKLDVRSQLQAVTLAMRRGWIEPPM